MSSTIPKLNTVGRLAEKLSTPIHRVEYILKTRSHITPVARAGNARLYSEKVLPLLRHELNAISARRAANKKTPHAGKT